MATEKIYYQDSEKKSCQAMVLQCRKGKKGYEILLDRTVFYPEGGGQPYDQGTLNQVQVLEVHEQGEEIWHYTKEPLEEGCQVTAQIDWERRLDGMHQHLGQHVLSGSFFNLFNANTFAIHLGSDVSTVDIYGVLTEEQVRAAEKLANKVIRDNLSVDSFVPSKSELKKLTLRRALPNTEEDIRIVKIGDFDINACCGLHPSSTQELRLIKIKKFEKHKEGTRIEFLAGERAVADSFKKDEFQNSICNYLNCNENEAINGIKNLNASLKEANELNKKLNILLAKYQVKEILDNAEVINGIKIVKQIYDDQDLKYISNLTSKLTENSNTIALMAVKLGERANLIFSCSKDVKDIKMNDLLKDAISLIDGKGGGSPFQAQGAGKNNSNLESVIDYAFSKVSQHLK